jgi:signal transduction histidine kinase
MKLDFDKIICGLTVLDTDYNILLFNEKASLITEYTYSEIKEENLDKLSPTFFDEIYKSLENRNYSPIQDTILITTKKNNEKYVQRNIEFLFENDIVQNLIISFIDVTGYKELENNFFNSQKLESLGEVTKSISLEYNNLLAAIYGFSSFLKSMLNPSNEMYNYLDIIEKSAGKASSLTNQLLSFAGSDYSKQSYLNFNKIITQNIDIFQKTINSNIKITSNLCIDDIYINWNENQLNQIVINTILNAKEALEAKGSVGGTIDITSGVENNMIKYVIKDDGIGVNDDLADKIFEPYFTTKEIGKHSGLGLSVTEGIVKNMGGKITLKIEGNFTIFEILFPYHDIDINKLKLTDLFGNNEKVLVIDDVDVMRNLASLLLKQKNYDPAVAASGKEGLEIIKNTKIDLVLLDIIMPDMNGEEVFYEIKKINPNLPIILLTGYSEEKLVKKLEKSGIAGIIVKPFENYDFFHKIHEVLKTSRV